MALVFQHQVEVREAGVDGGQTGYRAQHCGDHRYLAHQFHVYGRPDVAIRKIGTTHLFKRADAPTCGIQQAHVRDAPFAGADIGWRFLAQAPAAAARAAAHREIAGGDHGFAAVEPYHPFHAAFGREGHASTQYR